MGRGPRQEKTTVDPAGLTHPHCCSCGSPTCTKRATGIAVGGPKIMCSQLTVSSTQVVSFNNIPSAIPPDLGEFVKTLAAWADQVSIFQTCIEVSGWAPPGDSPVQNGGGAETSATRGGGGGGSVGEGFRSLREEDKRSTRVQVPREGAHRHGR